VNHTTNGQQTVTDSAKIESAHKNEKKVSISSANSATSSPVLAQKCETDWSSIIKDCEAYFIPFELVCQTDCSRNVVTALDCIQVSYWYYYV